MPNVFTRAAYTLNYVGRAPSHLTGLTQRAGDVAKEQDIQSDALQGRRNNVFLLVFHYAKCYIVMFLYCMPKQRTSQFIHTYSAF